MSLSYFAAGTVDYCQASRDLHAYREQRGTWFDEDHAIRFGARGKWHWLFEDGRGVVCGAEKVALRYPWDMYEGPLGETAEGDRCKRCWPGGARS